MKKPTLPARIVPIFFALPFLGLLLAMSLSCMQNAPRDVPVLMYHGVLPPPCPSVWSVSTNEFEQQLIGLREQGYTSILPHDLALARRGLRRLPAKPVIITFDDGLLNNMLYAEPLLARHGFRAICYLICEFTGEEPASRKEYREEPCLTWQEVRAMQKRGAFAFGIHSFSHSRNPAHEARTVADARALFKRQTGHKPTAFCYPYGLAPDVLRTAVQKAKFTTAMICDDKLFHFNDTNDLLRIPRVSVYGGEHDFEVSAPAADSNGVVTATVVNRGLALPVRAVLRDLGSGATQSFNPQQRLDGHPQQWQWSQPLDGTGTGTLQVEIWEQNGLFRYAAGELAESKASRETVLENGHD